jgi:predicted nuclease with TOPRIM domain
MTELLYLFTIKTMIDHNYLKVKISREEIEENHPHRTDLIKSMKETEADLLQIKSGWSIVTSEMKDFARRSMVLESQVDGLRSENKDLKEKYNRIMDDVEI